MFDELKTVAIYCDPIEANIVKTKLESEGIYCFVADEELMNSPELRTIIGQVRLQVKTPDILKAKKILKLN